MSIEKPSGTSRACSPTSAADAAHAGEARLLTAFNQAFFGLVWLRDRRVVLREELRVRRREPSAGGSEGRAFVDLEGTSGLHSRRGRHPRLVLAIAWRYTVDMPTLADDGLEGAGCTRFERRTAS